MEADRLEPGQVERGVDRARGDGAGGICVVVGGADGDHLVPVAVGGLEDGAGDVGPALHGARASASVGAVGGLRVQHVEDGRGHVAREGQDLVHALLHRRASPCSRDGLKTVSTAKKTRLAHP